MPGERNQHMQIARCRVTEHKFKVRVITRDLRDRHMLRCGSRHAQHILAFYAIILTVEVFISICTILSGQYVRYTLIQPCFRKCSVGTTPMLTNARARGLSGPTIGQLVLLADPHLVLAPLCCDEDNGLITSWCF
jgi:hypothetical protein